MDIKRYIKELLFLHDCVIIPGFGGFITSYRHAEIQKFQNAIYPPSKSVSFNKKLQSNDGILINHISKSENCAYKTAEDKVRKFADQCNRLLNSKSMLSFPDVGKIYINTAGLLIFLPDIRKNFLTDTFGLKPVSFAPAYQENQTEPMTTEPPSPEMIARKRKRRKRTLLTGLVTSVLLVLLFSQLIIWDIAPEKLALQNLNLFNIPLHEEGEKDMPRKAIQKEPEITLEGVSESKKFKLDEEEKDENEEIILKDDVAEKTATTKRKSNPEVENEIIDRAQGEALSKGYFIIFGSFENEANAEKLKNELKEKHGGNFRVIMALNGFYRVGILEAEKSKADDHLANFQATVNPSLWMTRVN